MHRDSIHFIGTLLRGQIRWIAAVWTAIVLLAVPLAADSIVLQLQDETTVTSRIVQLQDIATISARLPSQRLKAGALDIAEFDEADSPLDVSAELLRIRLILSGWSTDEIEIRGARKVRIQYREPRLLTDADVELAAQHVLAGVAGISVDDVQVRLQQSFVSSLPPELQLTDGLRVDVLPPAETSVGQVALGVRLWRGERVMVTRSARFEVSRRYRVAVARVSLQRDQPVSQDSVQFEQRFLLRPVDEPTEEMLIGQQVRTEVKAGSVLTVRDLKPTTAQAAAVVIKRRDNVRVVARSGRIQVTLQTAEAMQDGRAGDLIRLRNPVSKQLISGRVTAAGYVEIDAR